MSIIKDTFFGGAEKAAAKKIVKAGEEAQKITKESVAEGKGELNRLFPQAQAAGQQGFQGALDVFNQAVPQQQQAFQGGNVAAQQQILAGLPQIQNALFGNQVDLSGLQAFNPQQPDMSFLNQQLPFTQQQQINEQQIQQPSFQSPAQFNPLGGFNGNRSPNNMFGGMNPLAFNRQVKHGF